MRGGKQGVSEGPCHRIRTDDEREGETGGEEGWGDPQEEEGGGEAGETAGESRGVTEGNSNRTVPLVVLYAVV